MELKKLDPKLTVCKVKELDTELLNDEFCFVGKTDEELSLVCITDHAPDNCIEREDGWRAFRIEGVLDFSLIGIMAPITEILAKNKIGIFAVSTFNTDYFLVKEENFYLAMQVLSDSGYNVG